MDTRAELMSIIRDAWTIYDQTGYARDAELARIIEADARELLARLPVASRPKLKKLKKAKKRKAFKHCIRLDTNASRLPQGHGHVF